MWSLCTHQLRQRCFESLHSAATVDFSTNTQFSCRKSFTLVVCIAGSPLSSDRQHLSYDVCLEVTGDYQNCSVLYCVLKLCTVISTLRWAVLTVLWIGFRHPGLISLCV